MVGYFGGLLDGNVLRLTWREPAQPLPGEGQLAGEGWLVFEADGSRFAGRWWTGNRDRQGDAGGVGEGRHRGKGTTSAVAVVGALYGGIDVNGDGVAD